MKNIVICGSVKFIDDILTFTESLKAKGYNVYAPVNERETWESLTNERAKHLLVVGLTLEHFNKIEKADVVFVYNKNGYIGNSVTMEIGYAAACRKPILALEKDSEVARAVLYEGYTKNIDEFLTKL